MTDLDRLTIPEVAGRLGVSRAAVYGMLEERVLPGIRFGRRWIIARHAYEQWLQTCGTSTGAGDERYHPSDASKQA